MCVIAHSDLIVHGFATTGLLQRFQANTTVVPDRLTVVKSSKLPFSPSCLKGAEHVDPKNCTVPDGQCTNDLQGPMCSLYVPSPALARLVFWRTTLGGYTFHTKVTSTDASLTALQKSQRSVTATLNLAMMYRF
jgi:hypothetical protein